MTTISIIAINENYQSVIRGLNETQHAEFMAIVEMLMARETVYTSAANAIAEKRAVEMLANGFKINK